MEKKIFVAATEPRSGKSLVTIGLINALQGIVPEVGYMKPISQRYQPNSTVDEDAALIQGSINRQDDLSDINPLSMTEAQQDEDTLFERVFGAYNRLAEGKDVVVIEGTDYTSTLIVQLLIEAGSDLNIKYNDDSMYSHCQEESTILISTIVHRYENREEFVRLLLNAGADVNAKNSCGYTAFIFAAEEGRLEVVRSLLEAGANPNAEAQDGRTALINPSAGGHTEIVQLLLDVGADVNANYCAPLYLALTNGYLNVMYLLLDTGADANMAYGVRGIHLFANKGKIDR